MSFASIALTIDLFGINVVLPDIGKDLGLSDTALQWVVTAYYLGLAAPLVAAGRIGDLFGRRRLLVLGTLVFATGSVLAAVAESGGLLVASRLVAGVGAAFVTALSLTLVSDAFHDERRAVAIGTWSGIGELGAAAGPLIAGVVTEQLGWRWIFWINLPFSVVTIAVTLLVVAESRESRQGGPRRARHRALRRHARLPHVRSRRRAELRMDCALGDRDARDRGGTARRVRDRRVALGRPDGRARMARAPARGRGRDHRRVWQRRVRGGDVLRHALLPGSARVRARSRPAWCSSR